jgi:hypothetical protein
MANAAKEGIVLFLDRNRLYIYGDGMVSFVDISETAIKDLDIVDKDVFTSLITSLIDKNKIEPCSFFFVLSESVCFSRQLSVNNPTQMESEYQSFLSAVPFNLVISKRYQTKDGIIAVAANSEIIDTIIEVMESKYFTYFALIPALILGQNGMFRRLTAEMGKYLLDYSSYFKAQTLLERQTVVKTEPIITVKAEPGKKTKTALLLGIFIIALIALGALLFLRK